MKITDHVDLIDGTMANSYVIHEGNEVILIDAGTKSSGRKIVDYFKNNIKPTAVLITHYHPDHIGGLQLIYNEFQPEIYVPREEIDTVKGKSRMIPASSFMSRIVAGISKVAPVDQVSPADTLKFPYIEVIPTPGHTPGSTSYLYRTDNVIFVGDAFSVKSGKAVINKAFTLDLALAERSREKILSIRGVKILPGHGSPMQN